MNEDVYVNGLYWSVKLDLALLYYYFPDINAFRSDFIILSKRFLPLKIFKNQKKSLKTEKNINGLLICK
jgi:hypothetical protein